MKKKFIKEDISVPNMTTQYNNNYSDYESDYYYDSDSECQFEEEEYSEEEYDETPHYLQQTDADQTPFTAEEIRQYNQADQQVSEYLVEATRKAQAKRDAERVAQQLRDRQLRDAARRDEDKIVSHSVFSLFKSPFGLPRYSRSFIVRSHRELSAVVEKKIQDQQCRARVAAASKLAVQSKPKRRKFKRTSLKDEAVARQQKIDKERKVLRALRRAQAKERKAFKVVEIVEKPKEIVKIDYISDEELAPEEYVAPDLTDVEPEEADSESEEEDIEALATWAGVDLNRPKPKRKRAPKSPPKSKKERKAEAKAAVDITHMVNFTHETSEQVAQAMAHKHGVQKSRYCRSVFKNETCIHGSACKFAHELDGSDFNPLKCSYNDDCRNILKKDGKWHNKPECRKCEFLHKGETKEQLLQRLFPVVSVEPVDLTHLVTPPKPVAAIPATVAPWAGIKPTVCALNLNPEPIKVAVPEPVQVTPQPVKRQKRCQVPPPAPQKGKPVKTLLCRSVLEKTHCPHRVCRFAHKVAEWNPKPCGYGANCRRIHAQDRPCNYQHPGESKFALAKRLGARV